MAPPGPEKRPLNAFQLLRDLLAAAVGIRSSKERGREWSNVSTSVFFLAILIFVAVAYGAMSLFVYLVRNQIAQ